MKNRNILILSILVLVTQLAYFFISDGPYVEEGIPASVQLSGGDDDRLVLVFGTVLFVFPILYAFITLPMHFKAKDAISTVVYLISFTIWCFYAVAVNFDTSFARSFLFGDWYIVAYLVAPFLPVALLLYWPWLTSRSTGRASSARL